MAFIRVSSEQLLGGSVGSSELAAHVGCLSDKSLLGALSGEERGDEG
jgi:hypothetical protein